jgi:hypothetical protein
MATLRNLKIKTSTCKRIVKELRSYEKEVEKEAAKTADMKDKGADPYDLKQQVLTSPSGSRSILLLLLFFLSISLSRLMQLLTTLPCKAN